MECQDLSTCEKEDIKKVSNEKVLNRYSEFEPIDISESEKKEISENKKNNEKNNNNEAKTSNATTPSQLNNTPNQQIFEYDSSQVYKMLKDQKSAAAALLMAVPLFGAASLFSNKESNNQVSEENNLKPRATSIDKIK